MGNVMTSIFTMFGDLLAKACIILAAVLIPIVLVGFGLFLYYYIFKGMRPKKRIKEPTYVRPNFFKRLFWDFPKRFVLDCLQKDRDRYTDTGIIIFEGEQGSGKTLSAVEYIYTQLQKFPLATFSSNISVRGQAEVLEGIDSVLNSSNGIYGQLNLLDEIQNWFNSNESKNVPIEFVGEICQQRKQSKCIIGTTQRFNRMSKQLRQECTMLCKPMTILGCLTIVRCYKPNVDADGVVKKARHLKTYFFVHSDELREAYDTYEKVKRLNLKGFKPLSERLGNEKNADAS